jgi:hypothetical protein
LFSAIRDRFTVSGAAELGSPRWFLHQARPSMARLLKTAALMVDPVDLS